MQKTAYEMRIRDWSSDVGSSDLVRKARKIAAIVGGERFRTARAILEVGCGSGVIASVLAHLAGGNANVHAVDVVDNRVVSEGYAFQVVDGTTLHYSNDTFDIVVSNHVIEHVGNADAQRHHLAEIQIGRASERERG